MPDQLLRWTDPTNGHANRIDVLYTDTPSGTPDTVLDDVAMAVEEYLVDEEDAPLGRRFAVRGVNTDEAEDIPGPSSNVVEVAEDIDEDIQILLDHGIVLATVFEADGSNIMWLVDEHPLGAVSHGGRIVDAEGLTGNDSFTLDTGLSAIAGVSLFANGSNEAFVMGACTNATGSGSSNPIVSRGNGALFNLMVANGEEDGGGWLRLRSTFSASLNPGQSSAGLQILTGQFVGTAGAAWHGPGLTDGAVTTLTAGSTSEADNIWLASRDGGVMRANFVLHCLAIGSEALDQAGRQAVYDAMKRLSNAVDGRTATLPDRS